MLYNRLLNQKLGFCDMERDLGLVVIMCADLKVGSQSNQANRMLSLIDQEIIYYEVTRSLAQTTRQLFVRINGPHLEFYVSTWSPHDKRQKIIEKVQHRFMRMILGLRFWHFVDRLKQLELCTMEERRNRAEVFKIAHGFSTISLSEMFQLDMSGRTAAFLELKLIKSQCNKYVRKFFSPIVLSQNGLCWTMMIPLITVISFRSKLERERAKKMGLLWTEVCLTPRPSTR